MTLCCQAPSLTFGWKLGIDDDNDTNVLHIERIRCNSCGATYTLNDDEGCPLVNYSDHHALLRMTWHRVLNG